MKGIDISTFQRNVNYKKLKEQGIEFAIIRSGYGFGKNQKDELFEIHYKGFKDVGIKVGVYHYSYADSIHRAELEAYNCLEFIKNKSYDLPIFIDMEENNVKKLGKETCTKIAKTFCNIIKNHGYVAGIYANLDWWRNYLNYEELKGYKIWVAQWNHELNADFKVDYWQYGKGQIDGIDGIVDLDKCLISSTISESKKTNEEIADEVMKGLWGNQPDRQKKLEEAGYDYNLIQEIVNIKMRENQEKNNLDRIADEVILGRWGNQPDRQTRLEQAGYNYEEVQALVNKKLKGI